MKFNPKNFDLEGLIINTEELDAIGRYMSHILSDPCTELGEQIIKRTGKIFEITGTYDENFKTNQKEPPNAKNNKGIRQQED